MPCQISFSTSVLSHWGRGGGGGGGGDSNGTTLVIDGVKESYEYHYIQKLAIVRV